MRQGESVILSLKKLKILICLALLIPAVSWAEFLTAMEVKSFEEKAIACKDSVNEGDSICDSDTDEGLQTALNMANVLVSQMGAASGASIDMACSKMGKISMALNGALAAYKVYCSASHHACEKACDDIDKEIKGKTWPPPGQGVLMGADDPNNVMTEATFRDLKSDSKDGKKACNKMSDKLASASANIMSMYATHLNSKQCEKISGPNDDAKEKLCAQYPDLPMCGNTQAKSEDCSNPAVATTSLVCICISNPMDNRCGGLNNNNKNYNPNANDLAGNGSGTDGVPNPDISGGPSDFSMMGDGSGNKSKIADLSAKGGEGGGPRAIGGGGGSSAGGKQQGAAGGANKNILAGYGRGGKGGGGGSGGGGSSGGGGAGGGSPYEREKKSEKAAVDLKQFLPGAKMDPARGLAGIAGADGVTGPNSDNWKKIHNCYNANSSTLLP